MKLKTLLIILIVIITFTFFNIPFFTQIGIFLFNSLIKLIVVIIVLLLLIKNIKR